jgi:nucleotidyltransferase/DNA polymerase involved in DNA repair
MPTAQARKLCPKLIVLPGHYDLYEEFSNGMFAYAYDFTPDVERTSIDEGYFDLTANRKKPGHRNCADHQQGDPAVTEDHRQRGCRLEQAHQPDRFQVEQAGCASKCARGAGKTVHPTIAEPLVARHRAKDECAVECSGAGPDPPCGGHSG